ncbi:hypothetical protein ACFO8O_10795 [Hephaestia sp. GCM10023244]|uniref:hypothetical protein n=1 Tax=unclassified Hephaestia TaxID=2631281 RepID=UPI0020770F70|nr:hypothetical protein [Hephaestia sp. MAHUQ-44]MCM8731447.1 hypothetical protein [Hephaestia sp. MAHUQ-44]
MFNTGTRNAFPTIRLATFLNFLRDQGVWTMMAMVQLVVFAGALALIAFVLAETVIPALPRMAMLLRGEADPAVRPAFTPWAAPIRDRRRAVVRGRAPRREAA